MSYISHPLFSSQGFFEMMTLDILLFFGLEVHWRTMSYHGSIEPPTISIRIIQLMLFRWKRGI
jgi:hypothetical protein